MTSSNNEGSRSRNQGPNRPPGQQGRPPNQAPRQQQPHQQGQGRPYQGQNQQRPPPQQFRQQQQHHQANSSVKFEPGAALAKDMAKLSVNDCMFPKRPQRLAGQKIPGNSVALWCNLFVLSIKSKQPIYQYSVTIDIVVVGSSTSGDKLPRRLSREIRIKAIDEAIRRECMSKKSKLNYVVDSNCATLYTMSDFLNADTNKLDLEVELDLGDGHSRVESVKSSKQFQVKISGKRVLDFKILEDFCKAKAQAKDQGAIDSCLKAINAIVRGKMIRLLDDYVFTTKNVYKFDQPRDNQCKISEGVKAVRGFYISARTAQAGTVLNVANKIGAFYEQVDLVDFLKLRFKVNNFNNQLDKSVIDGLLKEIRNKQVEAKHHNYGTKDKPHYRKYRVESIGGSAMDKFMLVDKKTNKASEITIADYLLKEYKYKLRYPNLPCIVDKGRKLPLEVCHLIDKQRVLRKMTPDETAEMIKVSSVRPEVYFQRLQKNVNEIVKQNEIPMRDFQIQLEQQPIEVEGRELTAISLKGGSQKALMPRLGQYDVRSERFFRPAKVPKWNLVFFMDNTIMNDKRRIGDTLMADQFCQYYLSEAKSKGVEIGKFSGVHFVPREKLKEYFVNLNNTQTTHAIFVLPNSVTDYDYRYLQYLEALEGSKLKNPEQKCTRISCVKYQNYVQKIVNGRDQGKMFISNLWLKYNTKLGGINFVLSGNGSGPVTFPERETIFISIDVCHPAPGDKLIQSVAAVIGMWDLTNDRMSYCTRLKVQHKSNKDQSTIEEVLKVDDMVSDVILSYFNKNNKTLPKNIVIIRDGVSEGQFNMVLNQELRKIMQRLQAIYVDKLKSKLPNLSCMVVQKRHNTRFMRKNPVKTPKGDDFNIQPGTVVDQTVTHQTDFDFYIAPHKAIQGTSRPMHVYMILDQIGFSQDQAQFMIHSLSYLSPRCTKGTSIPTPVNLADLAAERGKNLVICWNEENKQKMSDDDRILKLNEFLSNIGDKTYLESLFYI